MKFLIVVLIFLMLGFTTFATATNSTSETYDLLNSTNLTKPGCDKQCGDLIVPYPFGIGSDCSLNHNFTLHCSRSFSPPKAFLRGLDNYTSIKHISDSNLRTTNMVTNSCYSLNKGRNYSISYSPDFPRWGLTLSEVNKLIVTGCHGSAVMLSRTKSRYSFTGCMVFCSDPDEVVGDECLGNGCCQSTIHDDTIKYGIDLDLHELYGTRHSPYDDCSYAFVGEENAFKFNGITDLNDSSFKERIEAQVPRVLEWGIGNLNCAQAKAKRSEFACKNNSDCVSLRRESGCKKGYQGNPYLSPGCLDIDECNDPKKFRCDGTCVNTDGDYTCSCKAGFSGDGKHGCQ